MQRTKLAKWKADHRYAGGEYDGNQPCPTCGASKVCVHKAAAYVMVLAQTNRIHR